MKMESGAAKYSKNENGGKLRKPSIALQRRRALPVDRFAAPFRLPFPLAGGGLDERLLALWWQLREDLWADELRVQRVGGADEAVAAEIVHVAVRTGNAHVGVRRRFEDGVVDCEPAGKSRGDRGEDGLRLGVCGLFGGVVGGLFGLVLIRSVCQAQRG